MRKYAQTLPSLSLVLTEGISGPLHCTYPHSVENHAQLTLHLLAQGQCRVPGPWTWTDTARRVLSSGQDSDGRRDYGDVTAYSCACCEDTEDCGRPTDSARSCPQSLHQHCVAAATLESLQLL